MADGLKWVNVAIAVLGSLAALGALNKMRWGETRPCIAGAMLLIAIGLGAQWIGELRGDWARVADTATFAGILVLLIASQRVPAWFLERWASPVASVIAALALAVVLAWMFSAEAHAADAAPDTQAEAPASVTLTPAQAARCMDEGGCVVVTRLLLTTILEQAQHAVRLAQEAEGARRDAERQCPGGQRVRRGG